MGSGCGANLLLVFCLWGLMISLSSAARLSGSRQKLEVTKHLNRLNKPAVKSIQSPDGDIIDCVHVSKQPAFDHPFLKDHKIQTRPNFHPEGLFEENKLSEKPEEGSNSPITQLWHVNGKCPEDTIPIRRTKEEDVLRASSVKRYGRKKHRTIPKPRSAEPDLINQSGHQHAIAYVEGDKYYGAKATINVWEPKIQQPNEFSLSQLWILGGSFGQDLNSIEAGWQVSPDLYGDNNTRLFTYWTSDAYQATGCYNLLCSGFIQVNSEIAMGASISPVSALRNSQYDISILIWKVLSFSQLGVWYVDHCSVPSAWILGNLSSCPNGYEICQVENSRCPCLMSYSKYWIGVLNFSCLHLLTDPKDLFPISFDHDMDPTVIDDGDTVTVQPTGTLKSDGLDPKEGHWWMQFGNDYVLGYWPSFLFSYLAESASMIEWGGEVVNSEPDGQHTSTQMGSGHFPEEGFGKASYFRNIQVVDSSNNLKAPKGIGTFTEQSNCYDVQTGSNGDWGHYFYYGGPGKNPNCQ